MLHLFTLSELIFNFLISFHKIFQHFSDHFALIFIMSIFFLKSFSKFLISCYIDLGLFIWVFIDLSSEIHVFSHFIWVYTLKLVSSWFRGPKLSVGRIDDVSLSKRSLREMMVRIMPWDVLVELIETMMSVLIRLIMNDLLLRDWSVYSVSRLHASLSSLRLLRFLSSRIIAWLKTLRFFCFVDLLFKLSNTLAWKLSLIH